MLQKITLALAGGLMPPPEVFLRCTPNYEADRAEILHSLWGILCAAFGKKILTGSCQVTELWRHKRYSLRPDFHEVCTESRGFLLMLSTLFDGSSWNFPCMLGQVLAIVWCKKLDRVRSGHGTMTSQEEQRPVLFLKSARTTILLILVTSMGICSNISFYREQMDLSNPKIQSDFKKLNSDFSNFCRRLWPCRLAALPTRHF